jgi:signal transduction histidine kinase
MNHDTAYDLSNKIDSKAGTSLTVIAERLTHKIRNPLSVIFTAASQMQESNEMPVGEEDQSYIETIMIAAERIEDTLKRFCQFTCREPLESDLIDLNELCRSEVDTFLAESADQSKNMILFRPDNELPEIACDPRQIRIMAAGIIENALQAVSSPGEVALRTGQSDRSVIITVEDNGAGVASENLGKVVSAVFHHPAGKSRIGSDHCRWYCQGPRGEH